MNLFEKGELNGNGVQVVVENSNIRNYFYRIYLKGLQRIIQLWFKGFIYILFQQQNIGSVIYIILDYLRYDRCNCKGYIKIYVKVLESLSNIYSRDEFLLIGFVKI